MKPLKNVIATCFAALCLATSVGAAPLDSGIMIGFLTPIFYETDEFGNQYKVTLIFPGDILIFTGKHEPVPGCVSKETPTITTVVVLDPTHQRHPVLVSIATPNGIPPGTRATIPLKQVKIPAFCAPNGFEIPGLAITD